MNKTVIAIYGLANNHVIKEADRLIAEELKEMNRRSKYCFTASEIAKSYGIHGSDLLSFLRDKYIVTKLEGDYVLTARYRNQGLTDYRYSLKFNQQGKMRIKKSLVWTAAGKKFLDQLILGRLARS